MRRIILAAISLMLVGGVASADRWRGGRDTSRHSGGTVVRDRRASDNSWTDNRRVERRDYRQYQNTNRVRYQRRPVYISNGRFSFGNGLVRVYNRPVIHHRYYDYRYRPQIIVENYDPVPGYIWIQGSWSWNGYEWTWTNGYYAPDPNYTDGYYDDNY
jgi:hypothetical protein